MVSLITPSLHRKICVPTGPQPLESLTALPINKKGAYISTYLYISPSLYIYIYIYILYMYTPIHVYIYIYIYIYYYTYIYAYTYTYIYIYIYIYIGPPDPWNKYGRFPTFHIVFSGRDPGTLKSDIVSKKHPQ